MEDPILIACPHCLASNRVPRARLHEEPRCGKCGNPLVSASPIELDDRSWAKFLRRTQLPVVLDLWASWCGPCRQMAPQFAAAAERAAGRIVFAKLDTEAAPATASQLGVQSIPTLVLFADGAERDRRSGAMSADQILQWLESAGVGTAS